MLSRFVLLCSLLLCNLALLAAPCTQAQPTAQPNVIFVMADDLGYGDLGSYGQRRIQTPRLDQMARKGMTFRQFYVGSTVCAPSRSVLMTGQHTGHTRVRGNGEALRPEDETVAEMLSKAGYRTGIVGKWGLGAEGSGSTPREQGFDYFFGYLHQIRAHNYYPEYLWENGEKGPLDGNEVRLMEEGYAKGLGGIATQRKVYSHDLFTEKALSFIGRNAGGDAPFFLYLPYTLPHANSEAREGVAGLPEHLGMEVPSYGRYASKDWPAPEKAYAAMVTRLDRDVGRLLDRLDALGISQNTLVMFTSDNGPSDGPHPQGHEAAFFDSNGPLRGKKRDLYEGGLRVPFIAHWPGAVSAGATSYHVGYLGDVMATFAELAGAEVPEPNDSISMAPALTGRPERQRVHEYLYWEFYWWNAPKQAVRAGRWKAIRRPMQTGEVALYDLRSDLSERQNVADQHPEVVERMKRLMNEAHTPSLLWEVAAEE